MVKLYGIKNCDAVKKARHWLESHAVDYQFHDIRADGLSRKQVCRWLDTLDWQILLNKRSTTWKQLPETTRGNVSEANIAELLMQFPVLIKRPVLEHQGHTVTGFNPSRYEVLFAQT
jgi:arsenate reductase (glutaredoxin)